MSLLRAALALLVVLLGCPVFGQTVPPVVAQAKQYVEQKPSVHRRIGLAEILRSHALKQESLDELRKAANSLAADDSLAVELQTLLCWRMLPIPTAQRGDFLESLATLKKMQPKHAWIPLWEQYLLASEANRTALLSAIDKAPFDVPTRFPVSVAEKAHADLLQELGWSRLQASIEVISSRSYDPLHALRELDRSLTREADFLEQAERPDEAKKILSARNRYRQAYSSCSRHLVEKLFALNLLGETAERDALLAKAKAIPYLHERPRLADLLERLDEEQAWKHVIQPLLISELSLVNNPPELAKLKPHTTAELQIKSRKKDTQGKTTHYEGNVHLRLSSLEVSCEQLTLVQQAEPVSVILSGNSKVRLRGFPAYPGGITADRFSYHAETASFILGGDIRLKAPDKIIKLRACTITQQGELRDQKSLLDDFRNAFDIKTKIELLPKITTVYDEEELPGEVRFVLALHLLRPHMSWHAPYLPPLPDRERIKQVLEKFRERENEGPWQEAFGGETWMLRDIPEEAKQAFNSAKKEWHNKYAKNILPPDLPTALTTDYFWRLRNPQHPDIAQALRLLLGIKTEDRTKARRWASEIRRNNTVLTFDIPGAAVAGKPHFLLMDVRNAEEVSFKLYRVQRPEDLLFAVNQIGTDFLYRDHGLTDDNLAKSPLEELAKKLDEWSVKEETQKFQEVVPVWSKENLVHQWVERVSDLQAIHTERYQSRRHCGDEDWYDDPDADYFDDACWSHRQRIDKSYRPKDEKQLSSWQCDRVIRVPEKALTQPGGYVLIAESNGQRAHVPIVVDPLSLTLRRCRDGVFVMVSDADGTKPIAGATVHARGLVKTAATDKEGAAFARVFAAGDRPIVVHHEGRFAIGGFGKLFEGIYDAPQDEHGKLQKLLRELRARRARLERVHEVEAAIYADHHVVVGYTDRPTYRPGQEVQFKLIVRKQVPDKTGKPPADTFRAEEFDGSMTLVLPNLGEPLQYDVLDPKGHVVSNGILKLNDFGTAAGKLSLNAETALGSYSFRVRLAGQPRLVPGVFAVKHYRRPNFEVQIEGVPAKLKKPENLTLKVQCKYYFGSTLSKGDVEVRVHRVGTTRAVAQSREQLDGNGKATLALPLPASLVGGNYVVQCSVTDESGRTVSQSLPLEIESPDAAKGISNLSQLPRFVPVGQALQVTTPAKEVLIEQPKDDRRIATKNGIAMISFAEAGWYVLRAGEEVAKIFAYGGNSHPSSFALSRKEQKNEPSELRTAHWVNLSDFTQEEDQHPSRWENPDYHLFALFDRRHANVGDKVRLLIYVPHERAKVLFTIEGRTILDYGVKQTVEKAGNYQVVEIPMKDRYFPNVYLQGRILAFQDVTDRRHAVVLMKLAEREKKLDDEEGEDPLWCRIDVARPKNQSAATSLKVEIETNKADYHPNDAVRATIKITDSSGRPKAAELSFAAVDESVFSFGEDGLERLPSFFRSPEEPRRFLPKVWRTTIGSKWNRQAMAMGKMSVKLQDIMKQMVQMEKASKQLSDEKSALAREQHFTVVPLPRLDGEMPQGTIPLARLREHFQETATWVPQLRTDESGVAVTSFRLPDSLTRYRLTAVALTKTTEVGVGRARITSGLPLAVQVFLPRFAVEKDRLQAVAVIHNKTDHPRDCRFEWLIEGATAEFPVPTPKEWKLLSDKGKFIGTGRVAVGAKGSAKVGLWLKCDQLGTAKVSFRAGDDKDADAERRTLPIEPLGLPREIAVNDTLAALPMAKDKFNKEARLQLPAGFLAREVSIHLACSELAQALDGLDYLVDYPYGCIEQTMSRFLPVVMIKHATQHAPVTLRPDIKAKLPDILERGLLRIYNFQHPDGSWGWFAKEGQNAPMTVYVVYGLARCKTTGTKVDAEVLKRGCHYLREELKANHLEPALAARAWYALALAGHADAREFEVYASKELAQSTHPRICCNLALACRVLGLAELGERFWARTVSYGDEDSTEWWALKLNTQIAYGGRYQECGNSARALLARREGTRWHHTRDTSWAIEALSNMLGYIPENGNVRRLQITLEGKTILDLDDPAELKKKSFRVRLVGSDLPRQEGLQLQIKADSDRMIFVSVNASGVQRHDEVKASGSRITLQRFLETLDGEPLKQPVKVGQAFRVRLKLTLQERADYLLIEERRPACCEFADDRIDGLVARWAAHQEFRDDRLCAFFSSLPAGSHEIVYYLRAETPGYCTILTGRAYPMYDERIRGETGASKMAVKY